MQARTWAAGLISLLLAACGGGGGYSDGGGGGGQAPVSAANPQPTAPTQLCSTNGLAAAAQSRWPVVCMLTSSGEMVIELYNEYAPITVSNFLAYANSNFYSNTLVHRVEYNFVVQGGGYAPGSIYKTPTFAPIALEDNTILSNLRGTISMARTSDPNSATSQWFINTQDNRSLDGVPNQRGYAVFGKIISGLATMDTLNTAPVFGAPYNSQPRTEILVYWVKRVQ